MISRTLAGKFYFVWEKDPALAKPENFQSIWTKYNEDGDFLKLPLKEGAKLTVFTLGRLTRRQFLRLISQTGLQADNDTVAYGLKEVENYEVDGLKVKIEQVDVDGMKRVSSEVLDQLYDPFLFRAMAEKILEISRLDPTRGQG